MLDGANNEIKMIYEIKTSLDSIENTMNTSFVQWGEEGLIRYGHTESDISNWSFTLWDSLNKLNAMKNEDIDKYTCLNKVMELQSIIYSFQ